MAGQLCSAHIRFDKIFSTNDIWEMNQHVREKGHVYKQIGRNHLGTKHAHPGENYFHVRSGVLTKDKQFCHARGLWKSVDLAIPGELLSGTNITLCDDAFSPGKTYTHCISSGNMKWILVLQSSKQNNCGRRQWNIRWGTIDFVWVNSAPTT